MNTIAEVKEYLKKYSKQIKNILFLIRYSKSQNTIINAHLYCDESYRDCDDDLFEGTSEFDLNNVVEICELQHSLFLGEFDANLKCTIKTRMDLVK